MSGKGSDDPPDTYWTFLVAAATAAPDCAVGELAGLTND